MDYADGKLIWGGKQNLSLVEKVYLYEGRILPNRMIKDQKMYQITYVDPEFHMNGFTVVTENDLVHAVTLFGHHPNRDPDTLLYCQPNYKKGVKYDQHYFEMLLTNIRTYYLDNCFFHPGKAKVRYRLMKSVYLFQK